MILPEVSSSLPIEPISPKPPSSSKNVTFSREEIEQMANRMHQLVYQNGALTTALINSRETIKNLNAQVDILSATNVQLQASVVRLTYLALVSVAGAAAPWVIPAGRYAARLVLR